MRILKYVLEFETNTYICIEKGHYFVVDPGYGFFSIYEEMKKDYILDFVLLTHCHYDHTLGLKDIDVPIYISENGKYTLFDKSITLYGMLDMELVYKKDNVKYLKNNEELNFFDHKIKIIFTPGHTKCSSCYLIDNILFTGDTLFKESIGRTDLPSGNEKEMKESLKLFKHFSNSVYIYPGHGDNSTIKDELKNNFYLK